MVIFKRRLGEKWQVSSMTISHPQWSAVRVSLIHRSVVLVSASLVVVIWFKMDEVTSVRQFRWVTRVQDGFTQKLFVYQKGWGNHPPTNSISTTACLIIFDPKFNKCLLDTRTADSELIVIMNVAVAAGLQIQVGIWRFWWRFASQFPRGQALGRVAISRLLDEHVWRCFGSIWEWRFPQVPGA